MTAGRHTPDSTKEVGPVSATLVLYAAQALLVRWSREQALSLIQLHALATPRHGDPTGPGRERLEQVPLLTINGVSAGLQNTG